MMPEWSLNFLQFLLISVPCCIITIILKSYHYYRLINVSEIIMRVSPPYHHQFCLLSHYKLIGWSVQAYKRLPQNILCCICYVWNDTNYMIFYVHLSSSTFPTSFLFVVVHLPWILLCHSWREARYAHSQFPSPIDMVMKQPLFTFLGCWGIHGPCTLETDRTLREIQSQSCRWLNFGPQIHLHWSLIVIGIGPLVHLNHLCWERSLF